MEVLQVRVDRRMIAHAPWLLVLVALVLAVIGVWNLASAARPPSTPVWKSQAVYVVIGMIAMGVTASLKPQFLQRLAVPIYVVNILALIALRFVGHTAKGAESWFALGPIRVQPAEFVKIGLILVLARHFHEDDRLKLGGQGLARLIKPMAWSLLPIALVLAQPDLGTALMLVFTAMTVILFAGVSRRILILLLVGFAVVSGVIWNDFARESPADDPHTTVLRHHLKRHQAARIAGWLNPDADQRGTNYHTAQSRIAVGSGGLTGKGWGKGTQTGLSFLPEQHTDFIWSVWAEEQGFIASVVLLLLYAVLLLSCLGVAFHARDRFGAFIAVGVAAMLFWQIFENVGMVIGLLPVTGITLPLMSYGGSSMLSVFLALGLLVNVSMRRHVF